MPKIKGEPVNSSLDEIEEGVVKRKCNNCGQPQIKMVLVIDGKYTKNYIGACTNTKWCFRGTDITKLETWQPATN